MEFRSEEWDALCEQVVDLATSKGSTYAPVVLIDAVSHLIIAMCEEEFDTDQKQIEQVVGLVEIAKKHMEAVTGEWLHDVKGYAMPAENEAVH